MLSQYRTDISLTIASATLRWLDYITGDPATLAFAEARNGSLDQVGFLCMQRIGMYKVQDMQHMSQLSALLAAIFITDRGN